MTTIVVPDENELRMLERGSVFSSSDSSDDESEAKLRVLPAKHAASFFKFGEAVVKCPSEGDAIAEKVWKGSLLAAAFLTGRLPDHGDDTKMSPSNVCAGLDVLEIGCGCGLAGLAAGAAHCVGFGGAGRIPKPRCRARSAKGHVRRLRRPGPDRDRAARTASALL